MPVTASTRPPVTIDAVGAGLEHQRVASSAVVASPVIGCAELRLRRGSPARPRPRCTAAPSRTSIGDVSDSAPWQQASASSARSESSSGSTACASGSPKRQLNSSSRGPSAVSIKPGVQHADVRRARRGEVVDDRLDELRRQLVGVVAGRRRRVGAHAAGVRAGVALADALVVLGDRQRTGDACRRTTRSGCTRGR